MCCCDRPVLIEQSSTTLVQERVLLPLTQRDHPRILAEVGLRTADDAALRHVQTLAADRLDVHRRLDAGRALVAIYNAAFVWHDRRQHRGAGGRSGWVVDDRDSV